MYISFNIFNGRPSIDRCAYYDDLPCIRGEPSFFVLMTHHVSTYISYFGLLVVCVSLFLVIRKVRIQRKMMEKYFLQNAGSMNSALSEEIELRRHAVKVASLQSLAYVFSFLLTEVLITVIGNFLASLGWTYGDTPYDIILKTTKVIFEPMTGFLNFIIFTVSKLVSVSQSHPGISFSASVRIVFGGDSATSGGRASQMLEQDQIVRITGVHFEEGSDGGIMILPYSGYGDDMKWLDGHHISYAETNKNGSAAPDSEGLDTASKRVSFGVDDDGIQDKEGLSSNVVKLDDNDDEGLSLEASKAPTKSNGLYSSEQQNSAFVSDISGRNGNVSTGGASSSLIENVKRSVGKVLLQRRGNKTKQRKEPKKNSVGDAAEDVVESNVEMLEVGNNSRVVSSAGNVESFVDDSGNSSMGRGIGSSMNDSMGRISSRDVGTSAFTNSMGRMSSRGIGTSTNISQMDLSKMDDNH